VAATVYRVRADWDPEAEVWVATSDDVPGLATESPTIEALSEKLKTLIPELLEATSSRPHAARFSRFSLTPIPPVEP
jgi:predicted RNase H-like HicB family nuclease